MYLLSALLASTALFAAPNWKAEEVMKKNEAARKIPHIQADGKIIIDGGSRKRMEKTFTWWRKLQPDGIHYNTLTKFHTPATVKDQSILFLEAANDKTEILMYLPAFKKTRIVESSQQNSSFMASDFSFTDITVLQNEDYSYSELGTVKCPNDTKSDCYHINARLKNPESAERLGYSKLVLWVKMDNNMSDRIHYYNRDSKLFKQLDSTNIVPLTKDTFFTNRLEMKNLTNGQFTIIEFSNVNTKKDIPASRFFKQRLGKDV